MKKDLKNKPTSEILTYEEGVDLYKQYLQTPRLDWQKEMRRPVRTNIYKAMCATHAKYGKNPLPLIDSVKKKNGKLFFWSDLHFYHHNIIKYASRPFDSVDHMNQTLLSNYWSTVSENDVVVFGGDIAFGDIELTKPLIQNLPGKKILVLGNHDFDKNQCIFRNYHCFDETVMAFVLQQKVEETDINILVTHYPVAAEALPQNTINIHGHIHQHSAGEKNINMSVEHTEFCPKQMESLIHDIVLNNVFKKEEKRNAKPSF